MWAIVLTPNMCNICGRSHCKILTFHFNISDKLYIANGKCSYICKRFRSFHSRQINKSIHQLCFTSNNATDTIISAVNYT